MQAQFDRFRGIGHNDESLTKNLSLVNNNIQAVPIKAASLGAAEIKEELIREWGFEDKGEVTAKLDQTAKLVAKGGPEAVETMRQFKRYADENGLKVSGLKEGERKRLLTVIAKVSVRNKEIYQRFLEVIQIIEKQFGIRITDLKQNEKVRIFTAAWATGKNLEIFKQLIVKIEELFGIKREELAGLELGEKIRLITAAYHVALSKEKGLEIFEKTLEEKRGEYLESSWENFSAGLKIKLVMDAYFEKHAYGLWKDELILPELPGEGMPETAAGASLGAAKTEIPIPSAPPLDDDEVRYLAFKLGFGLFTGNQNDAEKKLARKISLANISAVGEQVYGHIIAELPVYFENGAKEIEDLIAQLQKLTDQQIEQKIEAAVGKILNSMSEPVKTSLKPELIKSFTSTLREISKRVTFTEAGVEKADEAEKLYQSATRSEGETKMKAAETVLMKRLHEATSKLMKPNEKTVIVTHPLSLPETREEIAGMFKSAFAAAPNDALLGRPLLQVVVIVTDENGRVVRDYVAQSPFAANIEVKRAAPADLARVFEGFQKRAKAENLIFLLPSAKLAARESRVIQHQDSAVPNDLSFVKDALAEAAVGLARALKLPEGSREREDYLAFLQSQLGISWKQDPESRRIIISLDLKAFIENLVEIARTQRVTAIAA